MKIKMPQFLLIAIFLLASCTTATSIPIQENIFTPSAIPIITKLPVSTRTPFATASLSENPTSTPENVTNFIQPEPETWAMLIPAVQEYLYYRKKAIVAHDINILWNRYPDLKSGADIPKGINAEGFIVSVYQGLKLIDGNVFPEGMEQIKVKLEGDRAEVLVHGIALFLWIDEKGNFTDSGGEFKVVLFLQQKNNQWDVYKTDEVTMVEWHDFSP